MIDPFGPAPLIVGKLSPLNLSNFLSTESMPKFDQTNSSQSNRSFYSPSELFQLIRSTYLINVLAIGQGILQPSEILAQGNAIADVTIDQTFCFLIVFDCFQSTDGCYLRSIRNCFSLSSLQNIRFAHLLMKSFGWNRCVHGIARCRADPDFSHAIRID